MSKFDFVSSILYSLIDRESSKIQFYQVIVNNMDLATGKPDRQYKVIAIRKAFVMSLSNVRSFKYDLSFIAANKNFTFGGMYDVNTFIGAIKVKDLKGIVPTLNDHIICDNQKYEIKKVTRVEESCYELILTVAESVSNQKFACASTKIEFRGTPNGN